LTFILVHVFRDQLGYRILFFNINYCEMSEDENHVENNEEESPRQSEADNEASEL